MEKWPQAAGRKRQWCCDGKGLVMFVGILAYSYETAAT